MEEHEKIGLITGGSRGIGKAICTAMAREGIKIAVNHKRQGSADGLLDDIEKDGGTSFNVLADIRHEDQVKHMVGKVLNRFGKIDFLVNNAGIADQMLPTIEQDVEKWQRVIDIHLKGTYLCSKYVGKSMINRSFGRIVNISSIVGLTGFPMRTAYGPAKCGIVNLTKVLAVEWAPHNVTVNAIAPGYIRTEMVEQFISDGTFDEEKIRERIPLKRLGSPEEIANIVLFLCSDKASYITGSTIAVDGGWTAYGYL
jgi:NAD(P)-dependent dehydrogenase (short-subunit alcohol dehydrogenase family)